ncbi:MAG: energy transducer TonB [Lewinellaceae bacterium]|nr:energy transducer TonB [Lewinellaceae bacterium]
MTKHYQTYYLRRKMLQRTLRVEYLNHFYISDSELLTVQNKFSLLMLLKNAGMKKTQFLLIVLLSIGCAFNSFAQNDLKFEINKVLPFISIQENKLAEINTLTDLDKRYPMSWVKEYISVEISAKKNGIQTKVSGSSDVLNQEQKELIRLADRNSDIAVSVMYLPENSLKNNTVKQYDFKVTVMPDKNAVYGEGPEQLIQYLQKNSIVNIEAGSFTGYDLTAIKFAITEQGHITDIQVAMPSKDAKIDEMLVAAISKMPGGWKPAEFSNGLKVKQNFVLTVGNMENCMVNLLNIQNKETGKLKTD